MGAVLCNIELYADDVTIFLDLSDANNRTACLLKGDLTPVLILQPRLTFITVYMHARRVVSIAVTKWQMEATIFITIAL